MGWSTRTYWTYFSLCLSIRRVPSFLQKLLIFIEITSFEVILYERLLTKALYSRLDVHFIVSLPYFLSGRIDFQRNAPWWVSNFHLSKKRKEKLFRKESFLTILKGKTTSMDYEMLLSVKNGFALKRY